MIKLLFIDDQPIILRFLEDIFSDKVKYEIVGSLTQGKLAELWCEEKKPDAIFLDIQTKEDHTNGLKIAEIIKRKYPNIKIIMMTGFDEISYLPRAKNIRVDGFLFKSYPESKFIKALDEIIYHGKKVFPDEDLQIPVTHGQTSLTWREIEVLRLICKDYTNKEMASELFVSESTIKRHVEKLLSKTGKTSRAGLVSHAMSGGWIDPSI